MSHRLPGLLGTLALVLAGGGSLNAELRVNPIHVVLETPEASQQLLVSALEPDGRSADLTRMVEYEVLKPQVAGIDARGRVEPLAEGETQIVIRHGGETIRVPVEVRGLFPPAPVSFANEIIPILSKAGCNSGTCHGKAEGQNGFKLTVFGFDPALDHDAIVKDVKGRRLFPAAPDHSLLLRKATAAVPHGGGLRLAKESFQYRRLERWIAEGARFQGEAARVTAIAVEPAELILAPGESQQLRVTAADAAGKQRCVTALAEYSSNAETIAGVDPLGLIQAGRIPGEAAILVRYMDQVAVCRITLPRLGVKFTRPPEANFIDRLVWDKLGRLGIAPSELADDATFLRRVYLDTIGTLPRAEEARRFLGGGAPDKRRRLIDELLERAEYADYWALRWSDILEVDRDKLTPEGAVAVSRWLRRQVAENRRYDEFVRAIITARGDTRAEGPAALYKVFDSPEVLCRSVSQLFLGVRIECAQCHHHPFEKWGQDDYFALAGFFTGVARKSLPTGGEAILAAGGSELNHPRTGRPVPARVLAALPADFTGIVDRRDVLASWMTAPENPFLAKAVANRIWAHYFGRGLVEPVDDLRATNPATSDPLLAALAAHLRELAFDLKALTRTILNSRVYQLSHQTNAANESDEQNFSHAAWKALPAEVLLDAICQASGVPEKFPGLPEGYRAIQVWDNRMPSYFFRIFGRPVRASVCECERSNEPSISQALHLINSPEIAAKIGAPAGRARRLADSTLPAVELIDELYLSTLSRFPRLDEKRLVLDAFAGTDRRAATEDVFWALLNSKEFLYNH